jgi:hypothetical protein
MNDNQVNSSPPALRPTARADNRSAILEAMEYEFPTSKRRLIEQAGLSETTTRRIGRQLAKEGILTLVHGADPDDGRAADLVSLSRYPVLPVLEITEHRLLWRLCDTCGSSVFATIRDRSGFFPPEDDLAILLGQVSTILRADTCGMTPSVSLQPPVLLLPDKEPYWHGLLRRALDREIPVSLAHETAVARELRYHPHTQEADSVLCLHAGEPASVTLYHREQTGDSDSPFVPTAHASPLAETLTAYVSGCRPHSEAWWKRTADFLRDAHRFVSPACVVVETDRAGESPGDSLRTALPPSIPLIRITCGLNTPSLAHRGALRFSRWALWEEMLRRSDKD